MTLFPAGIPHNLCVSVMVNTSKQVLPSPSGLISNTSIITDVNYFELNINYKTYIRMKLETFKKYIYLLIVQSWSGRNTCGAGSSGCESCMSPVPLCRSSEACVLLSSVPALLWGIAAPHDHGSTSLNRTSSAAEVTCGRKHLCCTVKAGTDTTQMLQGQACRTVCSRNRGLPFQMIWKY
jgi:hypothetical protein